MELLKTLKKLTWKSVELPLKPDEAPPPGNRTYDTCTFCLQRYGLHDFHDCEGVFDEIRWKLEKKVPNSVKIRLKKKYGFKYDDPNLNTAIEDHLTSMSDKQQLMLLEAYQDKLRGIAEAVVTPTDWAIEDMLWNS